MVDAGSSVVWLVEWGACALFIAGAITDLRWRRVPNTIPVLLIGLFALHAAIGQVRPSGALWTHLAIGLILLCLGFALYLTGRFGAGDAKLIAVAGLWVGPVDLSLFLFGIALGAFTLCGFALLPLPVARRWRSALPFAVAIVPPTVAVLIPRTLSQHLEYPLP
ncbi:MAG: prepilin peptidase [Defluviicoccus sp.]|nr:prepilin peptidase [Defluviicoccus sp.]MDE0382394.1 prepilin peptidase [Defluviicoccus sp.]